MTVVDYHKTAEIFEHNGRKFMVVDTCELCDMKEVCTDPLSMSCRYERDDKKFVIYREINLRKELANSFVILLFILLFSLFVAAVIILFLDKDFILSSLLAVALLFVIADVIADRKHKG